ncbi:annexin D5-like isoform X2 [Prosopis cineraria]|uniref:annexin D5-like isoform X2 n=1 Tax=Prosopis cineraria TaxID=364024 RepID=UPI00240EC5A8|nr:annexin D5-like isoform X2 [Prosopis cineraria]
MSTLTTLPPDTFSARDDVGRLRKALKKGMRCKTSIVIEILAHRDSAQRDLILQEYETAYSEPLTKRISSELHGNLKKAMLLWMDEPANRDATVARQALTSSLVDYQAITEVICSRSPSQIRRFKEVYQKVYHTRLERDIEDYLSGDLKKDAMDLYKAGERKMLGTDEKTFIRIFSDRSRTHLAAIAKAYERNNGNSLEKAIKKETHGYFERGLLAILRCATNPALYFAKILRKSMKGFGTDDSRLIRVIVTRTEVDMEQIKEAYLSRYGKPLASTVRSDTSGHYKDFLLSLIGGD